MNRTIADSWGLLNVVSGRVVAVNSGSSTSRGGRWQCSSTVGRGDGEKGPRVGGEGVGRWVN